MSAQAGRGNKDSTGNTLRRAALDYAARGWFVNACKPNTKKLAFEGDHVLAHATRDPAVINEWWSKNPKSNPALVPGEESGFAVLDVDVKNGQKGFELLADVVKATGPWPNTRREKTWSGGEHIYFKHPGIVENFKSEDYGPRRGLEYFGKPFNLVAAPSIVNGKPYQLTDESDVAAMPDLLIEFIEEWSTKAKTKRSPGKVIPNGERNKVLFSFACGLRGRNTPDDKAWQLLQQRNQDCQSPLNERELRTIFKSAWKYPPGFKLTDLGNAERLIADHGDDVRSIDGVGWATWDEHHWKTEQARGRIMVMMADVVRGMYIEVAQENDAERRKRLNKHAQDSESRGRLEAAVAVAKWQPGIIDHIRNYDQNPLLIGLQNGIYDLRRDEFRAGRREDCIESAHAFRGAVCRAI